MVDAKAGASPGPNLGVIPDNYYLTYGSGPQIIHVDTAATRTGKPSIRLDQHTASDVNICRECDGTWYNVKPGDHIIAKVWIKTSPSSLGDSDHRHGGRIGIDFYAHTSAGYGVVEGAGSPTGETSPGSNIPGGDCILNWNNPVWTQKGWDIIVPTAQYTTVYRGGTVQNCAPVQIDSMVAWLDVRPVADAGKVWFADGELYINPDFTSIAPPPLPQNVQIAVSRVTASSYIYSYPPSLAVDGIESPYNYWGTNVWGTNAGVLGVVPQWLNLYLGGLYSINTVTTHFYDGYFGIYTYYLEVSNDSSSWTTIVSTKTGRGSVTDTFSQVGARFVRITVTANTAALIEEIRVYGFS